MQKSMHAIIVTGGKQYCVAEGDTLFIEKLNVEAGDSIEFDQVLALVDGENTKFGTPVVEGAKGVRVAFFQYFNDGIDLFCHIYHILFGNFTTKKPG